MKIKVNIDNLINLISNLLIRLRTERLDSSENLRIDLNNFVEYLDKFSGNNEEALFDNNFITSKEELGKLNEVINPRIPEIKNFMELLGTVKDNPVDIEDKTEIAKEHLRKIAAAFISLKNKTNF